MRVWFDVYDGNLGSISDLYQEGEGGSPQGTTR